MLKPNPEEPCIIKATCRGCGRKIWIERYLKNDFEKGGTCATCRTLGDERSCAQLQMAMSSGLHNLSIIFKSEKIN